jgi:oxygen-dependent protoporphyrinogen oxidase
LGELVDVLVTRLDRVDIQLNTSPVSVIKTESGVKVVTAAGTGLDVDAVILAVPAYASSKLLEAISTEASVLLGSIRHASTAVATLAFSASAFSKPLNGNGFLVPADENSDVTGCTYSSLKWQGRAPNGTILIRAFMGRDGGLDIDALSDDQLLDRAEGCLRRLIDAKEAPVMRKVDRWSHAMPQYELGHLDRIDEIERLLVGLPIQLAGTSYRGTGVPDCIRQGREAAQRLIGL